MREQLHDNKQRSTTYEIFDGVMTAKANVRQTKHCAALVKVLTGLVLSADISASTAANRLA